MRKSQLIIILALLFVLLAINLLSGEDAGGKNFFGGLPWYGWAGVGFVLAGTGIGFALRDAAAARRLLEEPPPPPPAEDAGGRIQLTPREQAEHVKNDPGRPPPA